MRLRMLLLAWCLIAAPMATAVDAQPAAAERASVALWPGGERDTVLAQAWHKAGADDAAGARALLPRIGESAEKALLVRLLDGHDALPLPALHLSSPAVRIPFRVSRNGTPLVDATVNGVAVELGVDTGAGLSVITESTARRVAARHLDGPAPKVVDSLGERVGARLALVDLAFPGVEFRGLPVLVLRDENLSAQVLGVTLFSFDGLVGWNALGHARVELDFGRGTMTLQPSRASCAGRNLWSLGFKPLVEVAVDGAPTLALVDTGARRTWLNAPAAAAEPAATGDVRLIAGASGPQVVGVRTREDVRLVAAGRSMVLSRLDERPGGQAAPLQRMTLGMDFLGQGVMVLDRGCGEFALTPAQP